MNLTDIIQIVQDNSLIHGIVIIAVCFIKIPKIKLNVWGIIGKSINKDVTSRLNKLNNEVSELKNDLSELKNNFEVHTVNSCRERILRFNSEIMSGNQKHNKEYYDEILSDIDKYEHYCLNHPEYPNNKAMLSIENIKKTYADLLERNDFYEK